MLRRILVVTSLAAAIACFASPTFAAPFDLKEYKKTWCERAQGIVDSMLDDVSWIDCLTADHAVAFAFAPQWEDAVRRAVAGATKTGKKAEVVLIYAAEDEPHLPQIRAAAEQQHVMILTVPPRPVGPAVKPELYVAVFSGTPKFSRSFVNATTEDCPILGPCGPTYQASMDNVFDKGSLAGIRIGMWGEWFGMGFEVSGSEATSQVPGNSASYTGGTFLFPMLRVVLFGSEERPGGLVNLYGGLGFGYGSGRVNVTLPDLPYTVGGNAKGPNFLGLAGVSLHYSHLLLFVEYQQRSVHLRYSSEDDMTSIGRHSNAEANFGTKGLVTGVGYRF